MMFNIILAIYLLGFVIAVGKYFYSHPGDYENVPLKKMFGWPYYFAYYLMERYNELRK